MASDTRKADLAQVRKSLSILKKRGLYKPAKKGPPTKYAQALARRYADVVSGKAFVLKGDKSTIEKVKERDVFRTRRGRVIVPKDTLTDRVRLDKKTGDVVKFKTLNGKRWRFVSANAASISDLPALKKGQTYVLPFRQGSRGIEFQSRADLNEFIALLTDYQKRDKNAYKDAIKYVLIGTASGASDDDDGDDE